MEEELISIADHLHKNTLRPQGYRWPDFEHRFESKFLDLESNFITSRIMYGSECGVISAWLTAYDCLSEDGLETSKAYLAWAD